jgi:hypothetical protein
MSSAKVSNNPSNFTVNLASHDDGRKLLNSKSGTYLRVDETNRSTKIVKNPLSINEQL